MAEHNYLEQKKHENNIERAHKMFADNTRGLTYKNCRKCEWTGDDGMYI